MEQMEQMHMEHMEQMRSILSLKNWTNELANECLSGVSCRG